LEITIKLDAIVIYILVLALDGCRFCFFASRIITSKAIADAAKKPKIAKRLKTEWVVTGLRWVSVSAGLELITSSAIPSFTLYAVLLLYINTVARFFGADHLSK
jgi:hypothetical protein